MKPTLEKRKMRMKPNYPKLLMFELKKIQTYGKHHPQGDGTGGNNNYFLMIQERLDKLKTLRDNKK